MTPSKTPFAGYEALGPTDPFSSDGWQFTVEDPYIADRLAKIGAVTHKHNGHPAMVNPTVAPVLDTDPTGGTIPATQTIYVCYTLFDADGGETLPCAPVSVATPDGYVAPATAPTCAVDYLAGTLLAGNLRYGISVTDGAGGETLIGPAAPVTIMPGHPNAKVEISGLSAIVVASSGGAPGAGWRLWRLGADGRLYLIATGAAATDTFTDDGVTGDCTVAPPRYSTTVGANVLKVTVPSAGQPAGVTKFGLYGAVTPDFSGASLLGTYEIDQLDVEQDFTDLVLTLGSPPAASRSYPSPNQLDPDTEINSPWRQKVAYTTDLPSSGNEDGDCRVVLHDHMIYMWWSSDSSWHVYAPGGGGGGGVDGGHADADFGLSISGGAASTSLFVADLDGGTA